MSSLNQVCEGIVNEVNGALACSVVDLNSGLLLAVHHKVPYFSQSYVDAVAAAAVDMFRGKNVVAVEKLLSQQRGEEIKNSVQEVQMATAGTYHFMAVVPGKPDALAVLVTNRQASLGMGWAALRATLPDIAPNCP